MSLQLAEGDSGCICGNRASSLCNIVAGISQTVAKVDKKEEAPRGTMVAIKLDG